MLVGEVRLTFGGGGERLKRILGCASSMGKEGTTKITLSKGYR